MADDEFFKPIFPTRDGAPVGASDERKMIGAVGGPDTIRTRIQNNADGSTTRLKTRGGNPEFVTEGGNAVTMGNWYHGSWDTATGWKNRDGGPQPTRVSGSTVANQSAAWSSGQPAHCAMLMNFEMSRTLWNTDEKKAPDPPTWKKNILHGVDKKFSILHTEGFGRDGWPYRCADKTVWFLRVSGLSVVGAPVTGATLPTPATVVGTLPDPDYYNVDYYGAAWDYAVVTFSPVDGAKAAAHYYKTDRDAGNASDNAFYPVLVAITELVVTGGSATTPPSVVGTVTCPMNSTLWTPLGRTLYGPMYGIHAGSLESIESAGPHLNYLSIQYDKSGNRCAYVQYLSDAFGSSGVNISDLGFYMGQAKISYVEKHSAISPPPGFPPGDLWEYWADVRPTLLIQCRKTTPDGEEITEVYRREWVTSWYIFERITTWGSENNNHLEQTLSGPDGVSFHVDTNVPADDFRAAAFAQEVVVSRVTGVPRMYVGSDMSSVAYSASNQYRLVFPMHTVKMMNDAVMGVYDPATHTIEAWAAGGYIGDHASSPLTLDTHDQVIVNPDNGRFSPTTTLYF